MWKYAGGECAWWSIHFLEGDMCSHIAPLFILSHGSFPSTCITWALEFVTSNLMLDELSGWPGDGTGCISLSVNGCVMFVRHSQADFTCQTAGKLGGLYVPLSEVCLSDPIRTCWYLHNLQEENVCLQIRAVIWTFPFKWCVWVHGLFVCFVLFDL